LSGQRDDDRWRPPNVEKQVRWFEELVEECGIVYTGSIVYRNDEEVGWFRPSKRGYLYPEILAEFGLAPHLVIRCDGRPTSRSTGSTPSSSAGLTGR